MLERQIIFWDPHTNLTTQMPEFHQRYSSGMPFFLTWWNWLGAAQLCDMNGTETSNMFLSARAGGRDSLAPLCFLHVPPSLVTGRISSQRNRKELSRAMSGSMARGGEGAEMEDWHCVPKPNSWRSISRCHQWNLLPRKWAWNASLRNCHQELDRLWLIVVRNTHKNNIKVNCTNGGEDYRVGSLKWLFSKHLKPLCPTPLPYLSIFV